jgi:adenylate cyclase
MASETPAHAHHRPPLFDRARRRLGDRYLPTLFVVGTLLVPALTPPAVAIGFAYAHIPFDRFLHNMAVILPWMLLVGALAESVVGRALAPLRSWLHDGKPTPGADAAWHAATAAFPRAHMIGALVVIVGAIPAGTYVVLDVHGGLVEAAIGGVAVPAFILACRIVQYLVWEEALKPLVHEAAVLLPPTFERRRQAVSLTMKIMCVVPVVGVLMGLIYGAFAQIDLTPGVGALILFGVLALMAIGIALPLTLMLRQSLLGSMDRLLTSMQQVHDGNLDANLPVVTGDELGTIAERFNLMLGGLSEREVIREAFGTYVDREVAEHILREGTSLQGEEVEVTMMFLDVRDFTSFAERLSAPEVVATLNRLFERIVPVIGHHGGHVDKYVGDGLLAVFGAPRRQESHADGALAAGLEIVNAVRDEFDAVLQIGVGLNSGIVVAGNVGGGGRLEFSVIGDAVNVAARVEAATRQTGDPILVAARTKELLSDPSIEFVERTGLTLRGKSQAVRIYAPRSVAAAVPSTDLATARSTGSVDAADGER